MAKKTSNRVAVDDVVPEILAVETFARGALDVLHGMRWSRPRTKEEYLARSRLAVMLRATVDAAEELVAAIEMFGHHK